MEEKEPPRSKLQLVTEHVDHELLTHRFGVTVCWRLCSIVYKDNFCSDIKVNSIYLHDIRHDLPDTGFEGESVWVLYRVLFDCNRTALLGVVPPTPML